MESIIAQIISIDELAQKRLQDASRQREEMRSKTEESIEETTRALREEAENRISIVTKQEDEAAQAQIAEIKEQNAALWARLEATCNENREKLETQIFENVVSMF